jgi:hypothetical protein
MHAGHIKDMVLRCLKLAFKVTRILGMILFSSRSEPCWFRWSTEMLEHTQLDNFHFDKPEDYLQIEDTTLSGVITPAEEIPDCFFPMYRTAPFLFQN